MGSQHASCVAHRGEMQAPHSGQCRLSADMCSPICPTWQDQHAQQIRQLQAEAHLGLLRLGGIGAIIILGAAICKHLGHGYGSTNEVGVIVQPLPDLHHHSKHTSTLQGHKLCLH